MINTVFNNILREWPTWVAIFIVYMLWWIVLDNHAIIPFASLFLILILTFHGSVQHELIHGHPTNNQKINDLLASPPIGLWCPYLIYKYFLIYFFSAPIAIWSISFTNFLGHLNMFVSGEVKDQLSFDSLSLYLFSFANHLQFVMTKYFLTYSYQSILVWVNLIIFSYNFNRIELIKKNTIILLFFGFFIVQSIILFRFEQDTYFLNSEILLIIPLIYLLNYLKFNKIMIFSLIFLISLSNLGLIKSKKYDNSKGYCKSILENKNFTDYYDYWTKHLPKNVVLKFCKDRI